MRIDSNSEDLFLEVGEVGEIQDGIRTKKSIAMLATSDQLSKGLRT